MTRPITGDCACGGWFVHGKRGNLRIRCDDCRKTRKRDRSRQWQAANPDRDRENHSDWYVANRQNNPAWQKLNKQRAKAWRAANQERIRAYREARA